MRALPDGGMSLTAAEAHVVSELLLRCSEDDYIALNLDEHCKGGLELAQAIYEHRHIAEDIRRAFHSEAADEMTDLELLGKVGALLARKLPSPVRGIPFPVSPIQNVVAYANG